MGVKLQLSGVTLAGSPARLRNDPRLTAGSLLLTDFTSADQASGVPTNGASVHNVAWQEAAALIGSGSKATLASTFNTTFTSGEGVFERTSKGAIHGVVSRAAQGGHVAYLTAAQAIEDYVAANPTREYALFCWADVTRVASSDSNMKDVAIGNVGGMAVNYLFNFGFGNILGRRIDERQKVGWIGSPNGTASLNEIQIAWGNTTPYNGLNANDGRSYVLYQMHLIDVAASGMTYAKLAAADAAFYASFFASGGRYYGDTYTPAASLIAS